MLSLLKRILNKCGLTIKYPYQQLSFSQMGEDIILQFIFWNLFKIHKPTYLDIGAHHPFFLSNTARMYINGSTGINIEPDPSLIAAFKKYRKRDVNLNIAISEKNEKKTFYIMSSPTLNTFSLEEAHKNEKINNISIAQTIEIESYNLEYILNKYHNNKMPDLLTIDVEGYELNILKSVDLFKYRPKVICVEAYDAEETKKTRREDLIDFIISYKYKVYADTGMNAILIENQV
jgi:FkbM family methyltransferase